MCRREKRVYILYCIVLYCIVLLRIAENKRSQCSVSFFFFSFLSFFFLLSFFVSQIVSPVNDIYIALWLYDFPEYIHEEIQSLEDAHYSVEDARF